MSRIILIKSPPAIISNKLDIIIKIGKTVVSSNFEAMLVITFPIIQNAHQNPIIDGAPELDERKPRFASKSGSLSFQSSRIA